MSDSVPKSFLYLAREFEEGWARGAKIPGSE